MTMSRFVTPSGVTVEEVVLSHTGKPTRPGDPAEHFGPRHYLRVTEAASAAGKPGSVWYSPSVDDLAKVARQDGWDVAELRAVPTHVVVDAFGGVTATDSQGSPLGREEAVKLAAERNAGMKPGYERTNRVYALTEVEV